MKLASTAMVALLLVLTDAPAPAATPTRPKLLGRAPSLAQPLPSAIPSLTGIPEAEPNDTRAQAQPFECGGMLTPATIQASDDVDVVTFAVPAGHWIVARTQDDPNSGGPQATDLMLFLSDAAGNEVSANDDWGYDLHSRLAYRSETGGTYYLKVTGYDESAVGAYQMWVTCDAVAPPANDACGGAQWIECGAIAFTGDATFANDDFRVGTSGCNSYGDPEYTSGGDVVYAIQATGGDVLDVSLTSPGIYLLYVTDTCGQPGGACFGQSIENGGGQPSELQVTFAQSGVYYLVVDTIYPNFGGEFSLTGSLGCGVVPARRESWGTLKSYYR